MTLVLPPLTDMVRADEYTLTMEQELRLLDDRQRRTRWWFAPAGTPAPGPAHDPETTQLTEPWLDPWIQLNDPGTDNMAGVCILNETDASQGLLIWVHPTEEARLAWQAARNLPRAYGEDHAPVPVSLGCETGIRIDPDYRVVFRAVFPLPPVSPGSVRWKFRRPQPDTPAWDVITGGWRPASATRRTCPPPAELEP